MQVQRSLTNFLRKFSKNNPNIYINLAKTIQYIYIFGGSCHCWINLLREIFPVSHSILFFAVLACLMGHQLCQFSQDCPSFCSPASHIPLPRKM